ncbi:MAG TPA: LuxR C-terminal-related transcriptional regulator, partial [Dehalococcoidia bacterium]|nr:LuxR C-terminal-related transcriptional regulator [Dehalococcoidia bacterium]
MTTRGRPRHPDILTPREWAVLELLRQRRTNEEIAEELGITLDGAKYHVSSILSKLGVASREAAAVWRPEARRWTAARWALAAAGTGVIAATVAGLALLALGVWLNADEPEGVAGPTAAGQPPTATSQSSTKILFAAVRDGGPDFDIYTVNSDGSGLTNVTDDPDAPDFYPSWSPDRSRIAYFSFQRTAVTPAPDDPKEAATVQERYLYVMNADGSGNVRLTGGVPQLHDNNPPAWSPDGRRIAFETELNGSGEVFVINVDGSGLRNVSDHSAYDTGPTWSPDGTQIAFASDRAGGEDIYVAAIDGSAVTRLTTAGGRSPAWSPDGTRIAFFSERDGNSELYLMSSGGSDQTNLSDHPAADFSGAPVGHLPPLWSPDGRRIAFLSDRDGNTELYVADADGSRLVRLTRTEAGESRPEWSPDGESVIFRAGGSLYSMNAFGEGEPRLV